MRNYFIDDEKNEFVVDLHRTVVHSSNLVEFTFSALETEKFRRWRDNSLVNYKLGRFFIKWYYKYGSEISLFLKKVKILKYITKFFLKRIANLLN